ncbi:MAG: DUF2312 domain-containing protein [Gammaproteobacteria bacterium]|nr:DUF2312 domain-containing protein [Gammaproteobacteria bacterium]
MTTPDTQDGTGGAAMAGHNAGIGQLIRDSMDEIEAIDEDRAALNAKKQEVRSKLKAAGVMLKAFDSAMKRRKLAEDPAQAQKFDEDFAACLKAADIQHALPL